MKAPEQSEADYQYFVVYDSKVGHYKIPFVAINEHDVIRQFMDLYKGPEEENNQYQKNPEDFQIFRVGSYWKKTGTILSHQPEHIANLHEIKAAALQSRRPVGTQGDNQVPKISGH